jgi:hypothetical protein
MQSVHPTSSRVTVGHQSLSEVTGDNNCDSFRSSIPSPSDPKVEQPNYSCDEPTPLYSVLPDGEKAFVIMTGSFAALISPLSSSIYLPALDSLAKDMEVSVSLINLTITTYLVRLINMWTDIPRQGKLTTCRYFKDLRPLSSAVFLISMDDVLHISSHSSSIWQQTLALLCRTTIRL